MPEEKTQIAESQNTAIATFDDTLLSKVAIAVF
jgi:hypothetical protein